MQHNKKRGIWIILISFYTTFCVGCFAIMKERADSQASESPSDLFGLDRPNSLAKSAPLSVREKKPKITVYGVLRDDQVAIFKDSACTQKIGEAIATQSYVVIESTQELSDGEYRIYGMRSKGGQHSECSINYALINVDTNLNQTTMTSLTQTTAISLVGQFSNLVTYDQINFYKEANCTGAILQTTTIGASQSYIDFHSLNSGTYQISFRVSYQDKESNLLTSNCVSGLNAVLSGQTLTTTYISRWQTEANNNGYKKIDLPVPNQASDIFDAVVNWGDGTSSRVLKTNLSSQSHTYANAGVYDIEIGGSFSGMPLNNVLTAEQLVDVKQWGANPWKSMASMFYSTHLTSFSASDLPNLSECTSFNRLFYASQFNGNLNNWDVSHVIDMSYVFAENVVFNQPLNNWNTASVTDMSFMFSGADSFNQPIGNLNTSNVTKMTGMFSSNDSFNQSINNWNTSKVTEMSSMFSLASAFNQSLSNWNTSSVTSMQAMFASAFSFNQDISNWNTSSVIDMSSMFQSSHFNQPIGSWDTSNVTNMSNMFASNITKAAA